MSENGNYRNKDGFAVFAGAHFYPGGGWDDFRVKCHTLDEAIALVPTMHERSWTPWWWQIVDLHTLAVVAEKAWIEHG